MSLHIYKKGIYTKHLEIRNSEGSDLNLRHLYVTHSVVRGCNLFVSSSSHILWINNRKSALETHLIKRWRYSSPQSPRRRSRIYSLTLSCPSWIIKHKTIKRKHLTRWTPEREREKNKTIKLYRFSHVFFFFFLKHVKVKHVQFKVNFN